jgi:flagellar FliJ protein
MAQPGFRLGQVLELKRRVEDQKQLALRTLLAEEQALQAMLQRLHAQIEGHVASMAAPKRGAVDAAELEDGTLYLEHLEALAEQRRADLEERAQRVAACRAELVTALQERRALEMLQARQDAEARQEAARLEARAVDDIVSARYAHTRMDAAREQRGVTDQLEHVENGASR